MKKVKTFLPLFSGFYGTIFESYEENELEYINEIRKENGLEPLDYDEVEFDCEGYRKAAAYACCKFVEGELKDLGLVENIVFENIYSPNYYNFGNDSINCEIWVKPEKLSEYVNENVEVFTKYLKENYSSRDGFISSHSNDFEEWKEETKNFTTFEDTHKLGAILGCVLENEDIKESYMYEFCCENGVFLAAIDFELETTKIVERD